MYINTDEQQAGEYTLTLESFNSLSTAQSALKTDTITITISSRAPSFAEEPGIIVLTKGSPESVTLPEVVEGSNPMAEIRFIAGQDIASRVTFDEASRVISYSGGTDDSGGDSSIGTFSTIEVILVDTEGTEVSYSLTLVEYPAVEEANLDKNLADEAEEEAVEEIEEA